METGWYFQAASGQVEGPLSDEALRIRAKQGSIRPETWVMKGNQGAWMRAEKIGGLFPQSGTSANAPTVSTPPVPPPVIATSRNQPNPQPIQWYATIDGEQKGPLSETEIRRWVSQRRILPDTFVRKGTDGEWRPASQFPELDPGSQTPLTQGDAKAVAVPPGTRVSGTAMEYAHPVEVVYAAALQAVRNLGYKIDSLDKNSGLITFKTGLSWFSLAGQEMSALVMDTGRGTCSVDVSGRRSQTGVLIQLYDWGERKKIARKVFAEIDGHLTGNPVTSSQNSDDSLLLVVLGPIVLILAILLFLVISSKVSHGATPSYSKSPDSSLSTPLKTNKARAVDSRKREGKASGSPVDSLDDSRRDVTPKLSP